MENAQTVNGSWVISGSMKATGESAESKTFRLKVKFDSVPLESVILKALEPTKIQWVNGQGRKNFDKFKENELIEINFKSPARAPQIDPEEAVAQRLATMTPEEQQDYIKGLMEKASK